MRALVAFGLLISLVAPAGTATAHHSRAPRHPIDRHIILGPGEGMLTPPGWYKFPGLPPIPPSQNRNLDPSNFGGG